MNIHFNFVFYMESNVLILFPAFFSRHALAFAHGIMLPGSPDPEGHPRHIAAHGMFRDPLRAVMGDY